MSDNSTHFVKIDSGKKTNCAKYQPHFPSIKVVLGQYFLSDIKFLKINFPIIILPLLGHDFWMNVDILKVVLLPHNLICI